MRSRLLAAAALIVLSQAFVVAIERGLRPELSALPHTSSTTLPASIGDFIGQDKPLDERLVRASDAEAMLNRAYRNRLNDGVVVNVGIWTRFNMGIPHSPTECYPSAGWEISSRKVKQLPLDDGRRFDVKEFVFQRDDDRIAVMYWVHLGDEVITDSESIRQLRQRLRATGENLPALVKVMLQTDARNLELAESRLTRFAAQVLPHTELID
ncbi:MAG TPA: EpsI family protein [Lacipirellula sp.]